MTGANTGHNSFVLCGACFVVLLTGHFLFFLGYYLLCVLVSHILSYNSIDNVVVAVSASGTLVLPQKAGSNKTAVL